MSQRAPNSQDMYFLFVAVEKLNVPLFLAFMVSLKFQPGWHLYKTLECAGVRSSIVVTVHWVLALQSVCTVEDVPVHLLILLWQLHCSLKHRSLGVPPCQSSPTQSRAGLSTGTVKYPLFLIHNPLSTGGISSLLFYTLPLLKTNIYYYLIHWQWKC